MKNIEQYLEKLENFLMETS